jgi:uncharacterized protein YprB with RNaseH-like and TPR domain
MVAPNRERLRRAFKVPAREPAQPEIAAEPRGWLRDFLQRRRTQLGLPAVEPRTPVALPAGSETANTRGSFFCRQLCYPLAHRHGAMELGAVRGMASGTIASLARDDSLAGHTVEQALVLATETTGLSGGAGTVVFLVGMAFLDGDELRLEQCFLRDFGEEAALLEHVAARLRERTLPVTFVGKSFDRHRLQARMMLHRIDTRVATVAHLDLYPAARRAWKKELPDCRLRTVEERKLGFRRDDDLPGSEAPAAWLRWLRDGTGAVDRVCEHNRLDVLSLIALLAVLSGTLPAA